MFEKIIKKMGLEGYLAPRTVGIYFKLHFIPGGLAVSGFILMYTIDNYIISSVLLLLNIICVFITLHLITSSFDRTINHCYLHKISHILEEKKQNDN